eukprot:5093155-Prymnesium_polylepis.1
MNRVKRSPLDAPAFHIALGLVEAPDGTMRARAEPDVETFRAAFECHVEGVVQLICSTPSLDALTSIGEPAGHFARPLGPAEALREAASPAFDELLSLMRTDCERVSGLVDALNALPAVAELTPM